MACMKAAYIEKIYSGWMAKIIGIRLGAFIEGWTYDKIKEIYGEVHDYPVKIEKLFAADDDSNGPLFFLRALEDANSGFDLKAQDVGEALLNYAPFEHGFFWWGGYGVSTEHTAYLNLRAGIAAPGSGSIAQNGSTVAEQIGGQIFIDTWGLVAPGNPDLAAKYAEQAASVTHGGNGVYGGIFVASCISYAFEEQNITKIIEKGLSYIPADCEYTKVVRAVMHYHAENPQNWRDCYQYIFENFGYDKYPGNCHIIPNSAVMILSLLYGNGDFSDTINICNMCGWDTDCNVGNIATLMGVRCGLEGIDYDKWRKPINDLLICSSVIGSLNIMDIPYGASYIAKLAWAIAGETLPAPWADVLSKRIDNCHFEYPGSTHAMCVRVDSEIKNPECSIQNTDETAHTGSRCLNVTVNSANAGSRTYVYKKTHYVPDDFHDSRYSPAFSPLLYPGQTIHGSVMLPKGADVCSVRLYAHNAATGEILEGECAPLENGKWATLAFTLPHVEAGLIDEAGYAFEICKNQASAVQLDCYIDDFYFDGTPDYTIDFSKSTEEIWGAYKEISQFTRLKGLLYLENEQLHLSSSDFGEAYTGAYDWADYTAAFTLSPVTGECHMVNVRVQGAIRSYAAGLVKNGKLAFFKNENGYRQLAETDFQWETGKTYTIAISAQSATFRICVDGKELLQVTDENSPYLSGSIGLSVQNGSHCAYKGICVGKTC